MKAHPAVKKLKKIATELTLIWGDTIYEGDYASQGKTKLDSVIQIMHGQTVMAYYIHISSGDQASFDAI